ncbi:DegV family protein [Candidatus Phytoplasma pini]|uniref:Putative BCR n=1 Tax=Candidatus Phytoplasma pini TaxID=267362 RepID=A0A559KJT6_9MOLU|nr:DegV family protein [Candidatus Phytoplasma pini]TVY12390.1 putative BCR [Candidatus Phytoplasma pini]
MVIKVVSTSTSCLDYYPQVHEIDLIRIKIYFNDKEFIDNHTTAYKFYEMLNKNPKMIAKTSQPSVGELVIYFRQLLQKGYKKVFVTTLSKELSGSYNTILQAQKIVKNEIEVIVYDTATVCFSEGFFALEAYRLFAQGLSVSEVLQHLDFLKKNNTIFFVVNSLTQLIQNGRLTHMNGFLGRLFRIKPILQVNNEGKIVLIDKHITLEKTFTSIFNKIKKYTEGKQFILHIMFTGNPDLKKDFKSFLMKKFNLTNILEIPCTPVVGAHIGNNVVGVGIILKS